MRHQYPNAQIVLSDDYIDGNRADRTVLNYLWHLKKDLGAILLRGNHEQMPLLISWIKMTHYGFLMEDTLR